MTYVRTQLFLLACAVFMNAGLTAQASPVLMISIDGLKPEYVLRSEEHHLHIPNLRRFLSEGTYADGVVAVMPTVTYPDHTTLITGQWPADHGILNNTLFDPEHRMAGAWYWYADSIRAPTLWDAAHAAGIRTASVSWPVSVNAVNVDALIPEYWRTLTSPAGTNPQDRDLMVALSRPDRMLADMQKRLGPYMMGNETTVEGDWTRTRFSLDILQREKPGFMTIHLSSLDESEHLSGPFSEEAVQTLESIDTMVGQLMNAALKNDPTTIAVIVSDHGFAKVDRAINLTIPFIQAGLIQIGKAPMGNDTAVTSWKAAPWSASGMAAIILHDAADMQTKETVHAVLKRLASDPANGIAEILDSEEGKRDGGFPNAAFVVAMKPGYIIGSALSGPLVDDHTPVKGTHGYLPSFPEMHASFFAMGRGIAKGRELGTIDMRQIAPTVAGILNVRLATAKAPVLKLAP